MRNKIFLASVAAASLMSAGALAQTTVGGGVTASTPQGSVAGGASAGTTMHGKGRMHRGDHQQPSASTGSSSSTYGSGTIYTDRNRATGGVTAGGTATGSGSTASGSSVDAYGSTTRQGSTGEVFGDSSATATTPTRH